MGIKGTLEQKTIRLVFNLRIFGEGVDIREAYIDALKRELELASDYSDEDWRDVECKVTL